MEIVIASGKIIHTSSGKVKKQVSKDYQSIYESWAYAAKQSAA